MGGAREDAEVNFNCKVRASLQNKAVVSLLPQLSFFKTMFVIPGTSEVVHVHVMCLVGGEPEGDCVRRVISYNRSIFPQSSY